METKSSSKIYHTDAGSGKEYSEYGRLYFVHGKNWIGVIYSNIKLSKYFPEWIGLSEVKRGRLYTAKMKL
ncbi:MAG: hypothetical protein QW292_14750 [Candidatus Parvarchaeota archaeon]